MTDQADPDGILATLAAEHAEVERALADPAVHADQARARTLGRRYAELSPIMAAAAEVERLRGDLRTARELAAEDESFADEAASLQTQLDAADAKLRELLLPKDPNDSKDVILEIKAGEGGEESALFASDLLRMYTRYAERQGWAFDVLDLEATDLGGVKSATVAVRARRPDQAVWRRLKYEGGVHRVQRVPATESQGRIHTSAAGVLVVPEAEEVDVEIDPNDLRVDVFRSSGPGRAERQHDRFGGSHHSPADRNRGVNAEREEPAAESGGGPAGAASSAAGSGSGRGGCCRRRRPPVSGPYRRSLGASAYLQLSGEPDQRSSGRVQGLQPRPGPRRRS